MTTYPLTYERKFFRIIADLLLMKEPIIMKKCREVVQNGKPGAVHFTFTSAETFSMCTPDSEDYCTFDVLRGRVTNYVDWDGYLRMNPNDSFIIAVTLRTPAITIHKTLGIQDDGGPPDVSSVLLYPKIAFQDQCEYCRGSTIRSRVVQRCTYCGTIIYCSSRCKQRNEMIHAAICTGLPDDGVGPLSRPN